MNASPFDARSSARRSLLDILILGGLLLGAVSSYFFVPDVREFANAALAALRVGDEARLRDLVAGFGVWGPIALLALNLVQAVLAALPALPIMIVSVLAYGPLWGGLLAWSGLLLASSLGYWIGRTLGGRAMERFVNPKAAVDIHDFVERYGFWAIVAARLSPLLPSDAVSIVAGTAKYGFRKFLLSTALGSSPVIVLIVLVGADVARLLWTLGLASVVTVVAFGLMVRRDRRNNHGVHTLDE
ncbi:TVP38/TMEM64 family protein [Deinococcus yavapaiensis]|uniref:TVP38/TMEM64 family membrane protein n=1 Tax=Deinococcus yavapaiensis KR-236 TaxID=694435 RepID=A0A318SB82_9DEIO|nr:TVP38/TMEM64 family protein [Deinococcus yavapaiensis]PYE55832.1 putative membrane protein YdjX (TVP38/TMEM64 family) [Deinococcus yavapaiensis KR-236]